MLHFLLKPLQIALWLGLAMPMAFANGMFQTVSGDVRAATPTNAPVAVAPNARIAEGTTVTTGPNSRATIRLDDGHAVVLAENSEFRLDAYRFDRATPQDNNIVVELLKGALRSVSGLIGGRNPGEFALRTATATIGIRGTDFAIALAEQTYVSVSEGLVSITNAAGSIPVGAGATAGVASATSLASIIPAGALPPSVAATFGQLNSVVIAAGAGGATASAAGGGLGTAAALGAAAAAAAAIAGAAGGGGGGATTGTTGSN
jgi:hypothetical protein